MCALTIASPSASPEPRNDSSWATRAVMTRVDYEEDPPIVPLSFRDLRVSPEDVTTVGRALVQCPLQELLTAVLCHEAGWLIPADAMESRARHMLMGKIGSALESMRSLEEATNGFAPSNEGFVGPLFRFVAGGSPGCLRHAVGAVAFSAQEVNVVCDAFWSGADRVCTWNDLRELRYETANLPMVKRLAPEVLDRSMAVLACMPWKRILCLPLWLPRDLSEEERYAVLAKVFWAMTYRGFAQEEGKDDTMEALWEREANEVLCSESASWPTDPVAAVLGHNCWVDTLEAWNVLFGEIVPEETCL